VCSISRTAFRFSDEAHDAMRALRVDAMRITKRTDGASKRASPWHQHMTMRDAAVDPTSKSPRSSQWTRAKCHSQLSAPPD
jgi:hypothetical protein